MATETTYLHLIKPTAEENPSVADYNGNSEKVDAGYGLLKNNLLTTYSQLRTMFQNQGNASAVAILDQAILDLSTAG